MPYPRAGYAMLKSYSVGDMQKNSAKRAITTGESEAEAGTVHRLGR